MTHCGRNEAESGAPGGHSRRSDTMRIGVIGSGSIGPDLAYGFATALAKGGGGTVHLVDIRQEALDAGVERIRGYVGKGVARGKLSPRAAAAALKAVVPTTEMGALAGCV